ncbi:MAG: TonB-dependent receptor, partial [Bryobacterales bacterium]|nr:TonB-dependent receptor [Bryobacterales bacterium]
MATHIGGPRRTFAYAASAWLMFAILGSLYLNAQGTNASISGTVTDSSNAVIPDATIQARNIQSGITETTSTDTQGRYRLPDLSIGDYEVQASKAGFQNFVRSGITLAVGGQNVLDFVLRVGQAQETVTVEAQVSQVDTQSTAVGALVEQTQMRELPLNGRNFGQLITLAPGVQSTPAFGGSFYGKTENFSIAGSRPEGTGYLLDDVDIAGFWNHGTGSGALGTQLGVDAIAEFQTLTNTYSAQFGGNGAVINAVTKSGSNSFHGSAYEFLRNSDLDARNFFDPKNIAPFRRNQFGGTIGGPIKKDKAFFFVNYEGLRQSLGETEVSFVPDANAHNGLLPIGPNGTLLNVGVAPNIASTLALYPVAQNEIGGGVGTYTSVASQPGSENYFLGRFDYIFSDKDSLFARYVRDTASLTEPFSGSSIPLWPETDITANHYATVEEKHIVSATIINLARVSFVRPDDSAAVTGSTPPLQFFPGRINGTVTLTGGVLSTIGAQQLLPFGLPQNKFSLGDDLFWTKGSHNLKFGITGERDYDNTYAPFLWGGQWTFPSLQSFLQGTAVTVVSALPNQDDAYKDFRINFFTPYIQDDWKVTSKLTLNMGLRYEFESNPIEVRHQMTAFIDPPFGGFQPVTHPFQTNPSAKNFNPRIGAAYDPFADHKTSIRAGFGIFHDIILPRLYDPGYWLNPPFAIGVQLSPNYPVPFAGAGLLPPQASQVEGTAYAFGTTPYMIQYNFNIQRDLGRGNVLTVGYVGSQGVHLVQSRDVNPALLASGTAANPVFDVTLSPSGGVQIPQTGRLNGSGAVGALSEKFPAGHSHYNSLQVSLNRRFSGGFQVQGSYTYSKS